MAFYAPLSPASSLPTATSLPGISSPSPTSGSAQPPPAPVYAALSLTVAKAIGRQLQAKAAADKAAASQTDSEQPNPSQELAKGALEATAAKQIVNTVGSEVRQALALNVVDLPWNEVARQLAVLLANDNNRAYQSQPVRPEGQAYFVDLKKPGRVVDWFALLASMGNWDELTEDEG